MCDLTVQSYLNVANGTKKFDNHTFFIDQWGQMPSPQVNFQAHYLFWYKRMSIFAHKSSKNA
jgi:hypothetical protein